MGYLAKYVFFVPHISETWSPVCMYVRTYVCMYVCMYVCIFTYIYIYTCYKNGIYFISNYMEYEIWVCYVILSIDLVDDNTNRYPEGYSNMALAHPPSISIYDFPSDSSISFEDFPAKKRPEGPQDRDLAPLLYSFVITNLVSAMGIPPKTGGFTENMPWTWMMTIGVPLFVETTWNHPISYIGLPKLIRHSGYARFFQGSRHWSSKEKSWSCPNDSPADFP